MAIEKTISIKVAGTNQIVEIEQAVAKTNKSTENLTNSQKQLESAISSGSKSSISNTNKLTTATDKATDSIKHETNAVKELNQVKEDSAEVDAGTLELMNKLDDATGGYIGKFKELQGGIKTGIGLFKSLKIAIAATGIGLLVVAISSLATYFTQTTEGGNKLAKIMSYVGVVTNSLIKGFSKLGELIVWVFENPKKAIVELGKSIKENFGNRIDGLLNLIPKLGNAMELVFKGKFKDASKVAVNALGKVVTGQEDIIGKFGEMADAGSKWANEMKKQANEVHRIAQVRADALKIENALIVDIAKSNRELANLRDKISNEDLYNSKQRQEFLKQANKLEQEITDQQLKSAQLKLDAISSENKLNKISRENSQEQLDAESNIINLIAQREQANRDLSNSITAIRKADAEKYKAIRDAEKAQIKEQNERDLAERQSQLDALLSMEENAIKSQEDILAKTDQQKLDLEKERHLKSLEQIKLNEEEKRNALIQINELYDLKQKEIDEQRKSEEQEKLIEERIEFLENLQATEEEKLRIISEIDDLILDSTFLTEQARTKFFNQQSNARIKIAEIEAENKEKLNLAVADSFSVMSDIIGRETGVGKTLAVASSLINTYSAIAGQLKAFSGVPIPGYAVAQSIATGLVGFKSVKDILSVNVPNSGGDGGNSPSSPAVNLVGSTDTNQIADVINNQTETQTEISNKPIRAYVVGKDIRTQEELERNASNSSSF